MDYGIVSFIGKFHPLLVHLPIGMLLIAIVFGFMSLNEKYSHLKGANHIVLFLSAISATLSAFTGWILSQSGGYSGSLVEWHQWMGLSLTVLSWSAFFIHSKGEKRFKAILVLAGVLLIVTGHLGGTITHGEGFLIPPAPSDWFVKEGGAVEPIVVTKEMLAYTAVANIVDRKCKSCHGPGNQKGKLRLDSPENILKGGENGEVIVASSINESHLIENILLPIEDEDHMPPKEKSQLSKAEIALLVTWVESGASFDKTIEQLAWSDSLIAAYNEASVPKDLVYTYIPQADVSAIAENLVKTLDTLGVTVVPVGEGSNYVSLNFLHVPDTYLSQAFQLLPSLVDQCVWLDLTGKPLLAEHLMAVSQLKNLRKLSLKDCTIADSLLTNLAELTTLEYVNLVNNPVSLTGIKSLEFNKQLQHLFLFQTKVQKEALGELSKLFPEADINLGGYEMPLIEADTSKIIY